MKPAKNRSSFYAQQQNGKYIVQFRLQSINTLHFSSLFESHGNETFIFHSTFIHLESHLTILIFWKIQSHIYWFDWTQHLHHCTNAVETSTEYWLRHDFQKLHPWFKCCCFFEKKMIKVHFGGWHLLDALVKPFQNTQKILEAKSIVIHHNGFESLLMRPFVNHSTNVLILLVH